MTMSQSQLCSHPSISDMDCIASLLQVDVTTAVANFFVDEARKNFHRPSNQLDEDNMLIYNYCPEFTGKHKHEGEETDFDECFFFPEWKGKNTAAAVSSQ